MLGNRNGRENRPSRESSLLSLNMGSGFRHSPFSFYFLPRKRIITGGERRKSLKKLRIFAFLSFLFRCNGIISHTQAMVNRLTKRVHTRKLVKAYLVYFCVSVGATSALHLNFFLFFFYDSAFFRSLPEYSSR